jgi:Prenylcysteine lyase
LFAHDVIQALTRVYSPYAYLTQVNYAQNLDQIQALEALVCVFASSSAGYSVIGGNWRIFDEMIIASGAKLHLNTPVLEIENITYKGQTKWKVSLDGDDHIYDGVVLASPYVHPFVTG